MVLVDVNEFDQQRFYLLVHKIKQVKPQFDEEIEKDDMAMKGSRYGNDDRIARLIVGQIFSECDRDIEAAKKKFLSLNSTEMMPYIKKAIIDSAFGDYYYTYEKRY